MADPSTCSSASTVRLLIEQCIHIVLSDAQTWLAGKAKNPTWSSVSFGVYICASPPQYCHLAIVLTTVPLGLDCSSNHRNYGVHISFVRSINLDLWDYGQLRKMKVGGNQAFADFLAKHPGAYGPNSSDLKGKYTSDAAIKYKDELARKAQADLAQFGPNRVWVEGLRSNDESAQDAAAVGTNSKSQEQEDDDFFNSWDKPAAPKAPQPTRAAAPPSVSLNTRTTASSSAPVSPALTPGASSGPRTVSSASLRSGTSSTAGAASRSRLGATRTNTSSSAGAASGGGGGSVGSAGAGGRSKLGAKRAGAAINFEEAERKAKEEEERIKQLGYDAQREAEEAAAAATAQQAAMAEANKARAASASSDSAKPDARISPNAKGHARRDSDTQRLGMGMARLGFGQVAGVSGADSAKSADAARKAADRKAKGLDRGMSELLPPRSALSAPS